MRLIQEVASFCLDTFGRRCFVAGDQILLHGTCRKMLPAITEEFGQIADCWINDPPYGTTMNEWDKIIPHDIYWDLAASVTKPHGAMVVFGSQPFTSAMVMSNVDWHRYCLVWNKNKCGSPGLAKYRPMKVHEDLAVFSRKTHLYYPQMEEGEPYQRKSVGRKGPNNHKYGFKGHKGIKNTGTRYPKSILHFPRNFSAQQQVHPTQKPTTLLAWLLKSYCQPRGIAVDITAGSFSLAAAAFETKRACICFDKEEKYFLLGKAWLTALHKGLPWDPAAYRKKHLELV